MFKDTIMDLEPNTKLIRSLLPITIKLTQQGVEIIDKGVRYYNIEDLLFLSSSVVKIHNYISNVIESWNDFLKREYPSILSKDTDKLIKLIEDDINDFIVILYETINELISNTNNLNTDVPPYPYNYVKLRVNKSYNITHDFYSPKDPEEYFYNRLNNIERIRYITIKGELMKKLRKYTKNQG